VNTAINFGGPIKLWEFFDQLRNLQLLKKDLLHGVILVQSIQLEHMKAVWLLGKCVSLRTRRHGNSITCVTLTIGIDRLRTPPKTAYRIVVNVSECALKQRLRVTVLLATPRLCDQLPVADRSRCVSGQFLRK
jgi:hypothetical protein